MIPLLIDHLLESTVFAVFVGLLTLRFADNRASVRYGLWFGASVKFLVPFSLIVAAGRSLRWETAPAVAVNLPRLVSEAVPDVVASPAPRIAAAFSSVADASFLQLTALPVAIKHGNSSPSLSSVLLGLWLFGSAVLLCRWSVQWLRLRAVRNASTPAPIDAAIPVRFSRMLFEPGLVGILHPVLLLPEGIAAQLTPAQLALVIEHELCHWRRRDNLTAAVHMVAELLFWFHPLVWWIGSRLVTERERACDESVLATCSNPKAYADSILEVCRFYVRSPLTCAPGVAGANLTHRVERIMENVKAAYLSTEKLVLLTVIGAGALLLPIASGLLTPSAAAAPALTMALPDALPAVTSLVPSPAPVTVLPTRKPAVPKHAIIKKAPAPIQITLKMPAADGQTTSHTTPSPAQSTDSQEIVTASTQADTPAARPTPPTSSAVEEIVVTGKKIRDYVATRNFVRNYTAPSDFLDQISRWQSPLCIKTVGLAPAYGAFITARLKDVAAQIGAPKPKTEPCQTNLTVVFTDHPQELLDDIRTKRPDLLGVHYPALRKKIATVSHPIQAWYATGTRDSRGHWELDSYDGWWGLDWGQDWSSAPVFMVPGSRLDTGLTSEFASVVIVADKTKIGDWEIGTIADYIAMTAFARANTLDKCQQVPSIANVLENCSDAVKATALSDFDVAYLKALYSSKSNVSKTLEESEISSSMRKILEKQVAARKP